MTVSDAAGWAIEVPEDLELPSWFVVPTGEDPGEVSRWTARLERQLPEAFEPYGHREVVEDVRQELEYAVQSASASEHALTFQIWPVAHPVSLLCHVYIVPGAFVPSGSEHSRIVTHPTESPSLGQGTQYSIEHRVETDTGTTTFIEVQFVFSNDDISIIFGLSASLAAISAPALPGLALLKDWTRLKSGDGAFFEAIPSHETMATDVWPIGMEN